MCTDLSQPVSTCLKNVTRLKTTYLMNKLDLCTMYKNATTEIGLCHFTLQQWSEQTWYPHGVNCGSFTVNTYNVYGIWNNNTVLS